MRLFSLDKEIACFSCLLALVSNQPPSEGFIELKYCYFDKNITALLKHIPKSST